jgi:hypothetical protein
MFGASDAITPFRYELNYRNYFLVTQGSIQIMMAPPKSTKYLYCEKDYENFEFRSPMNPWKIQSQYVEDFDKVKCLNVTLTQGKTIYIPSYWWYSIKFDKNASIACFRYRTYMNNIAILPQLAMYALQNQNVKRDIAKKVPLHDCMNNNGNNSGINTQINNKEEIGVTEINDLVNGSNSINTNNNNNDNNNNNNNTNINNTITQSEEIIETNEIVAANEVISTNNSRSI